MANINNKREWFLQLIDTRKKKPVNDDAGQFQVYQAGVAARQNIYNASGTLLTQTSPFVASSGYGGFVSRTMTDGQLSFYTNISCSTVDVSILTLSGRSYFLKALKPSNHRVDVDPERTDYTLVVPLDDYATSGFLRTAGFTLRKGMVINDAFVKTTRVSQLSSAAKKTFNVGVAGASSGFLVGIPASVTGYKVAKLNSSTGAVLAAQQYGALISKFATGTDDATQAGWFSKILYPVPTATVLSFARAVALTAGALTATFVATVGKSGRTYLFLQYSIDPTQVAVVTD